MNQKHMLLWIMLLVCHVSIGKSRARVDDIYMQWTNAQFGKRPAVAAKAILLKSVATPFYKHWQNSVKSQSSFMQLDNQSVQPDLRSWTTIEKNYTFITDFENLKLLVAGPDAKKHYVYWCQVLYYFKSSARTACLVAEMDQFAKQAKQQTDQIGNKIRLSSLTLDRRNQAAKEWNRMISYRQAFLKISGQKNNHVIHRGDQETFRLLIRHDDLIEDILGQPAPALRFPGSGEHLVQ
ncbi:MAG: hypothetical protein ACOH2A_11555 [Sphingobacteriaceae bacterium]